MPGLRERYIRMPAIIGKYREKLSGIQKRQINERIGSLKSKYDSISYLRKPKSQEHIDKMFYSFEDLPPFGKEYWFMKFTPAAKGDKRQLLAMFGRCTEDIRVNGEHVKAGNGAEKQGYMSAWGFGGRKLDFSGGLCAIKAGKNSISSSGGGATVSQSGKFPNYAFKVVKNGKEICSIRTKAGKGNACDIDSFFKLFAGFALANLYLDFGGTLNGKPFKGKCYLQKVIVIGPFVPWYWGRIVFQNGSILTYYLPRIDLFDFNYKLISNFRLFDAKSGIEHVFEGLDVKKLEGENPQFIVEDARKKVMLHVETYASHNFVFEKIGRFDYTEYLATVKKISIGGHGVDTKSLGAGTGLVEETHGYTL